MFSPGSVLFGNLLVGVHADDLHEATGGDRRDPVFGLALLEGPERRPEADEELRRLEIEQLGCDQVAGLVDHDHSEDRDDEIDHSESHERPPAGVGE